MLPIDIHSVFKSYWNDI